MRRLLEVDLRVYSTFVLLGDRSFPTWSYRFSCAVDRVPNMRCKPERRGLVVPVPGVRLIERLPMRSVAARDCLVRRRADMVNDDLVMCRYEIVPMPKRICSGRAPWPQPWMKREKMNAQPWPPMGARDWTAGTNR